MLTLLGRWLLGTALVSWRYMWTTTPLHRREALADRDEDLPPNIPEQLLDGRLQLAAGGVGPLFHRRFSVNIAGSRLSPDELLSAVLGGFHRFVPREVVGIRRERTGPLEVGEEFVVQMPGPWDGPVRVVQADEGCLRLATLSGHLEAGQVRFRAYSDPELLVFEVEAWARCATPAVHLLYARLRLAKEIQLNMWVRFCLSAVRTSQGRLVDGVHISTRTLPGGAVPITPGPPPRVSNRLGEGSPMTEQRFPFRFAASYRLPALAFGVTTSTAEVVVSDDELRVRFGLWRLRTPRSNVASVERTGGFQWLKTAGPAHLSLVDRGVTFATSGDDAVCVRFVEPVRAMDPTGRLRHPGMTVTVEDPSALMAALGR